MVYIKQSSLIGVNDRPRYMPAPSAEMKLSTSAKC